MIYCFFVGGFEGFSFDFLEMRVYRFVFVLIRFNGFSYYVVISM